MKYLPEKEWPEWLKSAKTRGAKVTLENGVLIWHSGDFLGGDFLGGDFLGGDFLGGSFRGGNFRGGNFWGGDFWGGNFRGGSFRGGSFRGGDFRGGDFRGGNCLGGNFLGGKVITVWCIAEGYPKLLTDMDGVAWIHAGCRHFCLADAVKHWADREDRPITRALLAGVIQLAKEMGLRDIPEERMAACARIAELEAQLEAARAGEWDDLKNNLPDEFGD